MTADVTLRPAEAVDAAACFDLDQVCFESEIAFGREMFDVLARRAEVFLLAESEGRMVGFVIANVNAEDDVGLIVTLDVHPEWRRRGIGSYLLERAEEKLAVFRPSAMFLQVFVENYEALGLYQKHGYSTILQIDDYYGPRKDALLMMKSMEDDQVDSD
ncbi:MAG: N-acetyltransferase [Candidatus Lernaella stagnicola]|nr:N-acetyltransferase [Candidatus Lernaella stagnicola]